MEAEKVSKKSTVKQNSKSRKTEIILEEGATILFTPTNKKLRITSIEDGEITFEQTP